MIENVFINLLNANCPSSIWKWISQYRHVFCSNPVTHKNPEGCSEIITYAINIEHRKKCCFLCTMCLSQTLWHDTVCCKKTTWCCWINNKSNRLWSTLNSLVTMMDDALPFRRHAVLKPEKCTSMWLIWSVSGYKVEIVHPAHSSVKVLAKHVHT